MADSQNDGTPWFQSIERHLEPMLGAFTARMAVRTAALRSLKRPPEQVAQSEWPQLIDGLRPMLNTLLGAASTQSLLNDIRSSMERK